MSKNDKDGIKFKKVPIINDFKDSKSYSQSSLGYKNKEKIKIKLMNEYDLSENDADKIIKKLETKKFIQNSKSSMRKSSNQNSEVFGNNKLESNSNNLENYEVKSPVMNQSFDEMNSKSQNVDDILSDIIPNYNQHISIEVKDVTMTFETNKEKIDTLKEMFIKTIRRDKSDKIIIEALKDVSFKIYQGEKVGIIGYNGVGKSTLLKIICGIFPPTEGEVITNGNISPLLSLGAGFDYNYSGRKNIFLNGAVLGYGKDFIMSKMDEIIEFSELGEFIDVPIKNYSSGMLAKLSFSIATVVKPDILIIDEVLSVGDVNFSKKSRDKMKSLMDGQTTVLLVSHSLPQIRELCDKAIWIDNGYLKEMGEVNKVCDHYVKHAEKATNEQLANIQLR